MTIFSKIIQNPENDKYRILNLNNDFLVMLSIEPQILGHTLVIPNSEIDNLSDLPLSLDLFKTTVSWADKIVNKLNAKGYTLKIHNRVYLVETDGYVNHLHFHIFPRFSKADIFLENPERASEQELSKIKKLIVG